MTSPVHHPSIMHAFPGVQFYDYTKLPNRKNIPANYSLTFSLADGNEEQALSALENGMSVAAVFRDKATVARYMANGFELSSPSPLGGEFRFRADVVRGDDTDLRFLDPKGCIVALYAKGNAKRDQSGFVRD